MAYNIPDKYQDLTPAPQLDKKTLNKMVWLSCFLQASFNYELSLIHICLALDWTIRTFKVYADFCSKQTDRYTKTV